MESLELATAACSMDDFLDFASDIGEEEEAEEDDDEERLHNSTSNKKPRNAFHCLPFDSRPLPELPEEDLEWLSNKDAFPSVETFILSDSNFSVGSRSLVSHHSPVSVLDTTTTTTTATATSSTGTTSNIMRYCSSPRVPVKARSKNRCRRRREQQRWWSVAKENAKSAAAAAARVSTIGRKCQHCGAEKTPQWRAGPAGPKTLCNACGVRYKSGRLVPEYRPASSPTFCSELHSNSHRKVLEMRRQKQVMGLLAVKPMDRGLG